MTRVIHAYFLIVLLGLSAETACAEWVALDRQYQSPGLQTVYIDPSTINRTGNLVTMTTLVDWTWMQGNRSPSRFYSTTLKKQFDCAGKRLRRLAFTDFYGRMGTGARVAGYEGKGNWREVDVESDSLDYALWIAACGDE